MMQKRLKFKIKILALSLVAVLGLNPAQAEETESAKSVWNGEDYPSNKKIVPHSEAQPAQNSVNIKPDPFQMVKDLSGPGPEAETEDLDPQGENLSKYIPLDIPLSERQEDILDPIQLDVDSDEVLDLSLEKALLIGLESNLPQRIIAETVTRDKWRFWQTGSYLLPDGFLGYTAVKRTGGSSFSSTTGTPINEGANYIAQFGVRYTLGPSQFFNTRASYYDWRANSQFQGSNLQELMRQTANQYYEVMRARGELAVRIEAVRQGKIQLDLNEQLDTAGIGTKFAVLQSKQQLAENELALEAQQSVARIAEVQLLTVLNMPLGTDLRLEESEIYKHTLMSPSYAIGDLIGFAMSNRPDITRRQLALKAARQRVNQSISEFAPNIVSSASINSYENEFGKSLEPRNLDTFKTASLGLDWPLLQGLGLRQISSINQKRAESRQAGLELENEMLQIENQVRDAFLRSSASEKQISTAEEQLTAASEALRLAQIRLKNGVGINIDLLDTQRNYVNAMISKVRAIIQYNQAQIDLLRSVGLISVDNILNGEFASIDDGLEEESDDWQNTNYSKV